MKNIIIGTAGHIDHGKTTLIKALTGRDTDRLKEEKERGITIELGFTWFDLPSGKRAGIVDVPGHERFIKSMLAGAGGLDMVILVIAADEGVMPQTKEHLNILRLLRIKNGIIAVTKKDTVEEDWLELVIEQIKEEIKDTFLEEAAVIPVSAVKGEGLKELVEEIDRISNIIEEKKSEGIFRLPIDRVFTITGFGTIVTGTLLSGKINEGDTVRIYPQDREVRVRSVQVHENSVRTAYAGQRVAVNLANVKVEELERGNVVASPGSMVPTMMVDARLEMLKDAERSIDNRDRLRLYHGTAEVMCRVILLDRDELNPGEAAFVQLRLEEEIACQKDDRFVIRTYSPMLTIAGGTILDSNPPKRKRYKEDVIEEFKLKEQGNPAEIIEQYIFRNSGKYQERKAVIKMTGNLKEELFDKLVEELSAEGRVLCLKLNDESYLLHKEFVDELGKKLSDLLEAYHKKNPLKLGVSKEEIKSRLWEGVKQKLSDAIFGYYAEKQLIKLYKQYVALSGFAPEFNKLQLQIKDYIQEKYSKNKFNPPKLSELVSEQKYNEAQLKMVFNAMVDMEALIKVDEEIYFSKEAYSEAVEIVKQQVNTNGSITLAQFRDALNTSRKYAMALLDDFDQNKITKRVGDERKLF
ncbi:MAG: selenocysteine-specific translation elongation factor [Bacillota bacterium]